MKVSVDNIFGVMEKGNINKCYINKLVTMNTISCFVYDMYVNIYSMSNINYDNNLSGIHFNTKS